MTQATTYVEIDIPAYTTQNVVMLHFDGVQDSTDIINSSALYPTAWYTYIDARLYTSTLKFGTASLGLGGSAAGYAYAYNTPEIYLGLGNFTIDFWFNHQQSNPSSPTYRGICGQSDKDFNGDYSWGIYFNSTSKVVFEWTYDGVTVHSIVGTTTYNATTNTGWHHCAVTRSGTTVRLFIDGVQQASGTTTSPIWKPTGNGIAVGNIGFDDTLGNALFYGYIDEFRLSPGVARWTANFTPPSAADSSDITSYRFAQDAAYLPQQTIPSIPSIKSVAVTPAIVSLGENLGQRASIEVLFRDHKHIFGSESYDSGTFWGKFRARYKLKLTGYPLRLIRGKADIPLENMQIRHYIIDSTDGPNKDGEFKIIAKDILKLADGDKAVAPFATDGFLVADITNSATTLTLSPSGIGDQQYSSSGRINIGGSEICNFTRSGDVLTLVRAQFDTTAVAHSAGDRAQECLYFSAEQVYSILWYLFVFYAGIADDYIPYDAWVDEVDNYLGQAYTALIAEPTSVETLASEIIEQAGLAVWWDDIQRQVRLQVLRPVPSDAYSFDGRNYMRGTFEIQEQPEKRLSEVDTYFALKNPLVAIDQTSSYQSAAYTFDATSDYSVPAIKTIFSRWIPTGGRSVAQRLNDVLLSRFRDPPRKFAFQIPRWFDVVPQYGLGYLIGGWALQELAGSPAYVPAQLTRIKIGDAVWEVEAEEISGESFQNVTGDHTVTIDSNSIEINLRSMHDSIYGTPVGGNNVVCIIQAGVSVGSNHAGVPAFDVGSWPGGVTITIQNSGTIQGIGGGGGTGGQASKNVTSGAFIGINATAGTAGGPAIFTRVTCTIQNAGNIWGGGGGGGGGGGFYNGTTDVGGGGGGGGGAGNAAGTPGGGGAATVSPAGARRTTAGATGIYGTAAAGGAGGLGAGGLFPPHGNAGAGGNPGSAGSAGVTPGFTEHSNAGTGGAAGASIDGISHVSYSGAGSRLGPTIN